MEFENPQFRKKYLKRPQKLDLIYLQNEKLIWTQKHN